MKFTINFKSIKTDEKTGQTTIKGTIKDSTIEDSKAKSFVAKDRLDPNYPHCFKIPFEAGSKRLEAKVGPNSFTRGERVSIANRCKLLVSGKLENKN